MKNIILPALLLSSIGLFACDSDAGNEKENEKLVRGLDNELNLIVCKFTLMVF